MLIGDAEVDHPKPNRQGQMGAVHHGSSCDRGLAAAGTALADVPATNGIKRFASAFRTHGALRKTLAIQLFLAGLFCVIPAAKYLKADCCRLCHDDILRPFF